MADVRIYIPTDSAQIVVDNTLNGDPEKSYTTASHTYMEKNGNLFTVKDLSDNEHIMSALVADIQNEAGDLVNDLATVEAYLLTIVGS